MRRYVESKESLMAQWDGYRNNGLDEPYTGLVYFIRHRKSGPIKVGYSKDADGVLLRFASLQTGNPYPLTLVAVLPGSRRTESSLHNWHTSWRLEGEWFRADTPGLNALIERYAVDANKRIGVGYAVNALRAEAREAA